MKAAIMSMLETLAISDAEAFESVAAKVDELRLGRGGGTSAHSQTSSQCGSDQAAKNSSSKKPTIQTFHPDFQRCAASDAVILLSTEGVSFRYSLSQLAKHSSFFSALSDLPNEPQDEADATTMNRIIEPPCGTTGAIHLVLSLIPCWPFTAERTSDQAAKRWNGIVRKSLYDGYLQLENTMDMLDACDFSPSISVAAKNILKVVPDYETFDAFAVAAAMDWEDVA